MKFYPSLSHGKGWQISTSSDVLAPNFLGKLPRSFMERLMHLRCFRSTLNTTIYPEAMESFRSRRSFINCVVGYYLHNKKKAAKPVSSPLDIKGAYDNVVHEGGLHDLQHCGLGGPI